jgi:lactate permease
MLGVWPAALTAGVAFAIPQFLVSNFHGPWLVDIIAAICSMLALIVLLKFWKPSDQWRPGETTPQKEEILTQPAVASVPQSAIPNQKSKVLFSWLPWLVLSLLVFLWGIPQIKSRLDALSSPQFPVPRLHQATVRAYPVVPRPTAERPTPPEGAVFRLNWLSATGTGILAAALLSGLLIGCTPRQMARTYLLTLWKVRYSLITIAAMLALGYVTKYSGTDATLGLALAQTGSLYPFFGTLLGWLGVALTGSDTASNVLFGGLQKITAEQTGINPVLMAAANSSGGVMGKMVDAQSIVVASTATNWYGHEGSILRYVFFHSIALATLVGILVYLQASVPPFTRMVVQ